MTTLLAQALAAIEQLPADAQDAIATRLLAEVADEQAWAARFAATTDAQWDRVAETVRRAIAAGDIVSLDDVFPPRVLRDVKCHQSLSGVAAAAPQGHPGAGGSHVCPLAYRALP